MEQALNPIKKWLLLLLYVPLLQQTGVGLELKNIDFSSLLA